MKINNKEIEQYRITNGSMGSDSSYGNNGVFVVRTGTVALKIIASDQMDWEHVSVSVFRKKRCPTWEEMCLVKNLFWGEDEMVVQYHPAKADYVDNHPYTLHMWRPIGQEVPKPPKSFV